MFVESAGNAPVGTVAMVGADSSVIAINPVVEGVYEFVETSLEESSAVAVRLAQELGPVAIGYSGDLETGEGTVRVKLVAHDEDFSLGERNVRAEEVAAQLTEMFQSS